jgi:hypothetical protein
MKRLSYTGIIVLIAILVVILAVVETDDNGWYLTGGTDGKANMDLKELEEKVRLKNWDALDIVDTAAQPAQALPTLAELVKDDDADVREIALNCVAMIDDPKVPEMLVAALSDEDDDIRAFALQALETALDGSILNDLILNLENDDPVLRSGVALLIGLIGDTAAAEAVSQRLAVEQDEAVKRDLKLSLAKLGDLEMKKEFADQFDVADSELRLRALDDIRYIGDRNLAPKILPALDDFGQAHLITEKVEPEPEYARVCDAAVNVISELCDGPFAFEVHEFKVYSEEELNEVKNYLTSLKAE